MLVHMSFASPVTVAESQSKRERMHLSFPIGPHHRLHKHPQPHPFASLDADGLQASQMRPFTLEASRPRCGRVFVYNIIFKLSLGLISPESRWKPPGGSLKGNELRSPWKQHFTDGNVVVVCLAHSSSS